MNFVHITVDKGFVYALDNLGRVWYMHHNFEENTERDKVRVWRMLPTAMQHYHDAT